MSNLHKLSRIMMRNYSAVPINLGSSNIQPGMLLNWDEGSWLGYARPPKIKGVAGLAWDYDGNDEITPAKYPSEHNNANILTESVRDRFEVGGSIPLPQYGLTLEADLAASKDVTLSIGLVTMSGFTDGFSGQRILTALRKTKGSDQWQWINDRLLVTEAYYASDLIFEFKNGLDASFKAKVDQLNVQFNGKFIYATDSTIKMVGNSTVPFAVRGLTV